MSAQSFLRAFHRDVKVTTSSADKAKAFRMYLVPGSEADQWYEGLPAATRADMDKIDTAIDVQYPAEVSVQPTEAEYATEILQARLSMEELGTKVKHGENEVWAHHVWINKVARLATKAGVAKTTTYIEQVRRELPAPLRSKVGKTHTDWPAFAKAIRDVDTGELELEMKEKREEKKELERVARLAEQRAGPQASPTAGIREQLTNTRIGAPTQTAARWAQAAAGVNPFQGGGGGGQGNLFAAPRAPYQAPAPRAPLTGNDRRALLDAIARLAHHPDTEAGRRAHGDQQQEWFRAHGNLEVSVARPYPLRPGRAPLNSGECFRCGGGDHTNVRRGCQAPPEQCLNAREQQWRRMATQALREPMAVRMASYASWDTDDYGRRFGGDETRFEEVDDQGNA
ncbi:hypothetical protein DFH06DRAFT_1019452 [Mycena polygramma]|nr:hypothetical protein DFH06DRAFT_1019452 [Mycena polygramma]